MTHTPGKWFTDGSGVVYVRDENKGIMSNPPLKIGSGWKEDSWVDADANDEVRANARLIAAAPDLLEALSWFINDIDETHTVMVDFDANVERARAAIARARGESA